MRKVHRALFALAIVLLLSPTAHAETSITAQELADRGPWMLEGTKSNGERYEATVAFETDGESITSIKIQWDSDAPIEATLKLFDGNLLRFEHVEEQTCGARTLRYEYELKADGDTMYFKGRVTGPRSSCRSGTFKDKTTLLPTPEQQSYRGEIDEPAPLGPVFLPEIKYSCMPFSSTHSVPAVR